MAPLLSLQPFRAIYTILFLLKTPPHLALLFVLYIAKPLRPMSEWSLRKCLASAALQMFFRYVTATRSQRTLFTDPKKAKERHTWAEPLADLFSGVLVLTETVKPAPVEAIWFPSPAPQDVMELKRQKVVLHFPGGAFVIAFGHDNGGQSIADVMTKHMKATRTVWAQYRLSGTPGTQFPAALQDALTFYHHIISIGVDPKNIILSGDSAGGNIVIALIRYLESTQTQLQMPGGAIVFSPWVSVTAHAGHDYDQLNNSEADILTGPLLQWGADAYIPEQELSKEVEAFISPLSHPFKTSVSLFIHAGAAEAFHDTIEAFADQMAQIDGNRVQFHATALAPHDVLLTHEAFGITQGLKEALDTACTFLEQS